MQSLLSRHEKRRQMFVRLFCPFQCSRNQQFVVFLSIFNFLLFQVQDLQVMRHTFEGVRVTGTFMLKSVIVKKTPSMAFSFDYIKDFSIMGGRFDRVSMWGFKLENCDEFNALGQSR